MLWGIPIRYENNEHFFFQLLVQSMEQQWCHNIQHGDTKRDDNISTLKNSKRTLSIADNQ
jgi:hypothetical protein